MFTKKNNYNNYKECIYFKFKKCQNEIVLLQKTMI